MAHLVWVAELDTGIDVIDAQHKRIVEYVNQLDDMRGHEDVNAINEIIESLVDYTVSHFGFEETLMEDAGYEFLRPHKKVHELFVKRVGEFKLRMKAGENIAEELHGLLARWLVNHIKGDDHGYVKAVKEHIQPHHAPAQAEQQQKQAGWFARFFGKK